jgi:hypothetical protein
MKTIEHQVDFCVVGGGLAGMCAAIAAARHGVKTLLMHERPVLGGNASSEIRMWVCGAHNNLETGLVEEFRLENLYRNTYPCYSVWDSILYEKARFQENLTLLLNCSCQEVEMDGSRVKSVRGYQQTTQRYHRVEAKIFADCSGDSIMAPLSGAEFRVGREARGEFNEPIAPEEADRRTMGMSCLIQARETDKPQTFIPPAWANRYTKAGDLPHRLHNFTPRCNFWWIELGGEHNSITDTEELRDELLKAAFGVWDYMKNYAEEKTAENWALDWVGFLPGKRESRRYVGDYMVTQHDVESEGKFDDIIAYGGWSMDDHHPAGLNTVEKPTIFHPAPSPYGLPYRSLYSKNIDNLMFAGRNISVTHSAMSSTRVMATCATLGQAAGTGAMLAVKNKTSPRGVYENHLRELQQILMDDDSWLPGIRRPVSALSSAAALKASSGEPEMLRNGYDRPLNGSENAWECNVGDHAEYDFGKSADIQEIRLVFDSDLKRPPWQMVSNYPLDMPPYTPPATLVKGFHVEIEDESGSTREVYRTADNYQRLVKLPCRERAVKVRLVIDSLRGDGPKKVFGFEVK